jgi:hypothetical protein
VDNGLTTEVSWRVNDKLMRSETVNAMQPITIRRWQMVFPSTADHVVKVQEGGRHVYRFTGREGTLEFSASMKDVVLTETLHTNDINSALGKGTRGPIPLMLTLEATNIVIKPDAPFHLEISLREVSGK